MDPNRLDHSKLSSHWQGITKPLQTIAQDTFVTRGDFSRADATLAKAVQEGFAERDGEAVPLTLDSISFTPFGVLYQYSNVVCMVTCQYSSSRALVSLRCRGVGQAWPNGPPRRMTEGLAMVIGERGGKGDIGERKGAKKGD